MDSEADAPKPETAAAATESAAESAAESSPAPSAAPLRLAESASTPAPKGLLGRLAQAALNSGGSVAGRVQEQLKKAETRVLSELRSRINQLEDEPDPDGKPRLEAPLIEALAQANNKKSKAAKKPSELLAELLQRSQDQTREQAQEALLLATLRQLTPDEARLLSALSDGSVHPLMHVLQSPLLGTSQMVLENASSLGRSAGVQLRDHTPLYITRLRAFGLVDFGPEDSSLDTKYEMLQTDATVLEALSLIEKKRRSHAKILRRSVFISAWGREVWEFGHRPFTVHQSETGALKPV